MSFSDAPFVVPPERLAKSGAVIDAHRLLEIITRAVFAFAGPIAPSEKAAQVRKTLSTYSEADIETFNMEAERVQKASPN
jgi:hypothetical protein